MPDDREHDHDPNEEASIARDALARGHVRHAAFHLALALASDPDSPERLELLDRIVDNAEDPLSIAPLETNGDPTYFGTMAIRAHVLARGGRLAEALPLVASAVAALPEAPFLGWVERWVARPEARGALAECSDAFAAPLGTWVLGDPDPALLARVLRLLERASEAAPRAPEPLFVRSLVLRRLGRADEALEVARRALELAPSWKSAVALAMAHQARGDVDAALDAYKRALELDPADPSARLDVGDMLLAARRPEESLRAYEDVLEREPRHPWAYPSACLLRARLTGDVRWRDELERLALDGNERAAACRAALASGPFRAGECGSPNR